MELRTFASEDTLKGIVRSVSDNVYDGNVIIDYIDDRRTRKDGRVTYILKLRAASSKGLGARRAASGRRTVSVCWHAHRDVMRAIYAVDPSATIITMLATYDSASNFEATYGFTGTVNVGSMVAPGNIRDLCDCPTRKSVASNMVYRPFVKA